MYFNYLLKICFSHSPLSLLKAQSRSYLTAHEEAAHICRLNEKVSKSMNAHPHWQHWSAADY